jgi:CPA1 family monovalent cation:H+ antiporter
MALFESTLILMLVAILLLQVSRRLAIPYPTILATAGVIVAALPWAPDISIDPQLALALFIAPALLDAAYDFPPRALRRFWMPLIALAAMAVVMTTAAVAWFAVAWAGLPLAAAIALGAIVSPPDAAAATAMLSRFPLPRSTVTVLKGESLLNDAVALLIFSAAVMSATTGGSHSSLLPQLALAVPGGLVLGIVFGKVYVVLAARLTGTLGGIMFEFVSTFGVWIIAERLHLSAILCVVAYAMTIARYNPERQPALDRLHSYSVWETTVFVLNVLAFLLLGLQARAILTQLDSSEIWHALGFAGAVFLIVVVVRIAWVMLYNRVINRFGTNRRLPPPTLAQGIVVSWCGMRGLVTLATALALPMSFPGRDLIVLSALAVVLGTLVVQGLTLGPLIRRLRFPADASFDEELASTRIALLDAGLASLHGHDNKAADFLRKRYQAERAMAADGGDANTVFEGQRMRRVSLAAQRRKLFDLRRSGEIEDDVFHVLENELDRAELAVSSSSEAGLVEG